MRLILHNPHNKPFFGQSLMNFIMRDNVTKKSQKYRYILDFLGNNKIKFGIYLDYFGSSLPKLFQKKIFIKIEVFLWLILKKINPFKVSIVDNFDELKQDDVFLSFSLTTLDTNYHGIDKITNKNIVKIFHFTHFVQNTSLISQNFARLGSDFIIAENNLAKNSDYFRKHFNYYNKDVYTLPFTYGNKYKNIKKFNDRENKCLSVGAIINVDDFPSYDDFKNFYKIDTLQPLRKEILNKNSEVLKYIDTINTPMKPLKKTILNMIKIVLFGFKVKYFKINIVERFNNYKMFICGEEINDLPGISFVEGMACGCAYIGKVDPMYTDLGLIPGTHYIGHNGSLDDIINKIKYYNKHNDELEKIARNGCEFVTKNFSGQIVAKKFYDDIKNLIKSLKDNSYNKDKISFFCSFINLKNK